MTKPTQELLLKCLSNLNHAVAIGAHSPEDHPAPEFIQDMEDRELLKWDVEVYGLALEALMRRELSPSTLVTENERLKNAVERWTRRVKLVEERAQHSIAALSGKLDASLLCDMYGGIPPEDPLDVTVGPDAVKGYAHELRNAMSPVLMGLDVWERHGEAPDIGMLRQQIDRVLALAKHMVEAEDETEETHW